MFTRLVKLYMTNKTDHKFRLKTNILSTIMYQTRHQEKNTENKKILIHGKGRDSQGNILINESDSKIRKK